jgi:signal transduction histidine kinase
VLLVCVQCGAAQTLATRDPRAAGEAIAVAREAAHTALTELDRLARVLPPQGGEPGLGEGLGGLTTLVDDLRASGLRAELRIAVADEVDPALAAALYRIVQESLTNAGKHAPGADVTVDVLARDGIVDLRVSNPYAHPVEQSATGHGLRNMRERTEQHGGRFGAGPEGGEWVVRATWDTRAATFAPPTTRPSTDAAGQTHP